MNTLLVFGSLIMKINCRVVSLLFLAFILTSCSTFQDISDGLDRFSGKHVDSLIDVIGYPTYQQKVGSHDLYIWDSSQVVTFSMPKTTYHSGSVSGYGGGYGTYGGTSTTYVPQTYNYNCKITIEVDNQDRIIDWNFEGNIGGCERYAKAFR